MRPTQQQFKIQVVKRNGKSQPRKFSADHRYRERPKERAFTPSLALDKLRQTISYDKERSGCLNTIFQKQLETKSFGQICDSFLSKKNIQLEEQECPKRTNFNTMLQNIKNVIKQNQRKGRELKASPEPMYNNEFQCVRSQIHQIYASNETMDIYQMIRGSESRNRSRNDRERVKSGKRQKPETLISQGRQMNNPFSNLNTVVCFTMALNDSPQKRQPLFQAPITRSIASANHSRRSISISKPSQNKGMTFNLTGDNDENYLKKLKKYFDFLFKINYSNNIYVCLQLDRSEQTLNCSRYKVYIGKGNNSQLIKSLMQRRFWWDICDSLDSNAVNFCWSQNIMDKVEGRQVKLGRSDSQGERPSRRRRETTEDLLDLNRKILSLQKTKTVQKFITKDGFVIPFPQTFTPDTITNHLPRNYCIGSKKNLFKSLFHYFTQVKQRDPFDYIPKTYHIRSTEDKEYGTFLRENEGEPRKVWIVKPGENSNRGKGIRLCSFSSISQLLKKAKHENGQAVTYIVQSYINRPFLYNNRKFDIRHFMMLTSVNGVVKAYWYKEGYIRTSSEVFDLQELDNEFIHLTNDAIQKQSEDYQRYEPANKISYSEFQRYLDYSHPAKMYNFQKDILPKIKEFAAYIVKANYRTIDHKRHQNNFQIFGLDFMIDRDFKPWLIEVNYNPCLEVNCPVLERVIPVMLQNSFRIGLDPLFPPTSLHPASKRFYLSDNYLKNLKYELIFDEDSLRNPINNDYDFVDEKEEEEEYQDEGQQLSELAT